MRLDYQVSQKDLEDAIYHDLIKKQPKGTGCLLPLCIGLVLICALLGIVLAVIGESVLLLLGPTLLIAAIILVYAFVINKRALARRTLRGRIRSGEMELQYFGSHTMELREDGLYVQYGTMEASRRYAGIQKVEDAPVGLILYHSQVDVDIIPKAAFRDMEHRRGFLNELQARIARARDEGVSQETVDTVAARADHTLEYTWDQADFADAMVRAARHLYGTRLGWPLSQIIATLIGAYLLLAAVINLVRAFVATDQVSRSVAPMAGVFALCVGGALLSNLLIAFIPPLGRSLFRKRIEANVIPRDFFMPQTLCFGSDRFTELRRQNTQEVMYGKLHSVREDPGGMYLLLKGRRAVVIPAAAFRSDAHRRELAEYLAAKIAEYR